MKHYTAASVRGVLAHNTRAENYSNPDIDPSRSKYNYSLSGHDDDYSYYEKRLSEVHHMKRANLNTLSSWVITLPKGIKHEDQKRFFQECKNFLDERYGEKNCVSADVHFDETTPHLHYTFIPVVWDQKKNREKVSCKDLFRLKELYSFHDDLEQHLTKTLGYQVGIRTGKTEKNVSIRDLKNTTKAEIIKEAQQIADKCVTEAHKEACMIVDKAEDKKRYIDDFYAEKWAIIKKYELTEKQSQKVYDEQFALQEKKKRVLLNRVWVDKDFYDALLAGAPHARTLEQMQEWIEEHTTLHNAAAYRAQMQEQVIDNQKAQIERLKKQNAEQQKLLEEHGLAQPELPSWRKKRGRGI